MIAGACDRGAPSVGARNNRKGDDRTPPHRPLRSARRGRAGDRSPPTLTNTSSPAWMKPPPASSTSSCSAIGRQRRHPTMHDPPSTTAISRGGVLGFPGSTSNYATSQTPSSTGGASRRSGRRPPDDDRLAAMGTSNEDRSMRPTLIPPGGCHRKRTGKLSSFRTHVRWSLQRCTRNYMER